MSHNLSEDSQGANLFLYREPAWHNLGTVVQEETDLKHAFEIARLNYEIYLLDAEYSYLGNSYPLDGVKAVVRTPEESDFVAPKDRKPIFLGTVSEYYELHQNSEICEWFQPLSEKWKVETAGALGKGEKIFFTLDCGEVWINGELVHQFILVTDDKTGKEKTKVLYTPVRVVCQNTLRTGIASANFTLNVRHSRGSKEILQQAAELALDLQNGIDQTNELFGKFGQAKFDLEEYKKLLKTKLYPEPKKDDKVLDATEEFEKLLEKQQIHVEACVEVYKRFNDEQPKLANTAWAAYNAVVEYEDHLRAGRGDGQYSNVLFGQRAKIKTDAFSAIAKTIK